MQGKFHAIYCKGFVPSLSCYGNFTQTVFDYRNIMGVRNVLFMPPPAVIGVAVGNDALIYGPPSIDINIGFLAVNALLVKDQ